MLGCGGRLAAGVLPIVACVRPQITTRTDSVWRSNEAKKTNATLTTLVHISITVSTRIWISTIKFIFLISKKKSPPKPNSVFTMAVPTRDTLHFSPSSSNQIDPYLPNTKPTPHGKPYVTLTFATSLDSQLSLAPGVQTALSGPESKAMTHYLRSKHDAILIGVGTAEADNPSLNCRIAGVGGYGGEGLDGQPRPVVIDPRGRWRFTAESKVLRLAREGKGRAPWVFTRAPLDEERTALLESVGGRVVVADGQDGAEWRISWKYVLDVLGSWDIGSVMIEGGGAVINDLLAPENIDLVDAVIVTIAPTWLGKGGVQVCPDARVDGGTRLPVARLTNVKWIPLGDDVVLCGSPS
ncbi:dihydrofolate reductase-like domain-containing protein [Boeremia exigua]|uniref:dihydrofolate reductase-like domain-containing protein n=1 Tax=Boeremia exigua TaxID=749465 RepID=UPI001E8DE1F0|nr:dihydrofolate reductase-like domain-containing protein [Boeremia exigua]KAH6632964.1 dihydrofolate reductase-like domain-containing protein [Boeremia exigua]